MPLLPIKHHVQPGDTCFSIAAQYLVSFDDLLEANASSKVDFAALRTGQVFSIPTKQKPRTTYTVRQGDTMWRISQLTGMPLSTLMEYNSQAPTPPLPGHQLSIRSSPSYEVHVNQNLTSDLPQRWLQDEQFVKVLSTQIQLLKPQGEAVFKYPSVEAPQLECFVSVQ